MSRKSNVQLVELELERNSPISSEYNRDTATVYLGDEPVLGLWISRNTEGQRDVGSVVLPSGILPESVHIRICATDSTLRVRVRQLKAVFPEPEVLTAKVITEVIQAELARRLGAMAKGGDA